LPTPSRRLVHDLAPARVAVALLVLAACAGSAALAGCGDDPAPAVVPEDAAPPPPPPVDAGPAEAAPPPLDVPDALVKTLDVKPYVEGSCTDATYPGWPYEAKRCTYRTSLVVTVANPPADRVARWIVSASTLIPALDGLRARDRASWEKGLSSIALHTLGQSTRIFPLSGQVWENGTVYKFERGVTSTCGTGCFCRINSTSRQQWCKYQDKVLRAGDEKTCLATTGQATSKLTEAWLARCMANHVASWTSDANENYRVQAWNANLAIATQFPNPERADGAAVVAAIEKQYPR
jgi:hypothetical protein